MRIKVNEPDLEIFTINVAKANSFCHLQLRQLKQTACPAEKRGQKRLSKGSLEFLISVHFAGCVKMWF